MFQIAPNQVTPILMSMFYLGMPTGIRALAVLAGGNNGKIFVDDPTHPLWCMVWEADDGTLYRVGYISKGTLNNRYSWPTLMLDARSDSTGGTNCEASQSKSLNLVISQIQHLQRSS